MWGSACGHCATKRRTRLPARNSGEPRRSPVQQRRLPRDDASTGPGLRDRSPPRPRRPRRTSSVVCGHDKQRRVALGRETLGEIEPADHAHGIHPEGRTISVAVAAARIQRLGHGADDAVKLRTSGHRRRVARNRMAEYSNGRLGLRPPGAATGIRDRRSSRITSRRETSVRREGSGRPIDERRRWIVRDEAAHQLARDEPGGRTDEGARERGPLARPARRARVDGHGRGSVWLPW